MDLYYPKLEDVPIPTRKASLRTAVYVTRVVPLDVVLVRGTAQQVTLLTEAARSAGAAVTATIGRPTCAVLPETRSAGRAALSFGRIGYRVYTGADQTEAYLAIPRSKLEVVEEESLAVIVRANQEFDKFHRAVLAPCSQRSAASMARSGPDRSATDSTRTRKTQRCRSRSY